LFQIFSIVEAMRLEHIRNTAIEAFHHAVGAWRTGFRQSVFDTVGLTLLVENVLATGLAFTAGKQAISEFLAIVGQQLGDTERASLMHFLEKSACTGGILVGLDSHMHPAGGTVNGHEQVASLGLIRHLRQVFDVNMHKAWFIDLEGLVRRLRFLWFQFMEFVNAMATQAAIQTGT